MRVFSIRVHLKRRRPFEFQSVSNSVSTLSEFQSVPNSVSTLSEFQSVSNSVSTSFKFQSVPNSVSTVFESITTSILTSFGFFATLKAPD
jgi:hypothetical protein